MYTRKTDCISRCYDLLGLSQLHDSASSGISGLSFKGKTPEFDPLANKNLETIETKLEKIDYVAGFYRSAKFDGDCLFCLART